MENTPRTEQHSLLQPHAASSPVEAPPSAVRKDRGNKIPRSALSPEAEELRKVLRQDIEECLRGIVGEGMQDLSQNLREWLSHVLQPKEEARSRTAAPGDADGRRVPSKVARVDSEPLDPPSTPSTPVNEHPSYLLPACTPCTAADRQDPQPAEDAARVSRPDEVPSAQEAAQARTSGSAHGRPSSGSESAHGRPFTTTDGSLSNTVAMGPRGFQRNRDEESQAVRWEWERSNNKGWGPYTAPQSATIEEAWQSGAFRVRVRSGCDGRTPMEIYFMDMVQLDPESEVVRRIRRVGEMRWYTRPRRFWRSISHSFETGEPLWETLDQYRLRQAKLSTADGMFVQRMKSRHADAMSPVRGKLRKLVKSEKYISFLSLSCLATLCWCVWFGVDLQRYPDARSLYEKETLFFAFELFFNVFFLVELVIRMGACVSLRECINDTWIRIDALCVFGSAVDMILVPMALALIPSVGSSLANAHWAVFRSLRLFKLLRIARLSRASLEMNIFIKGIWSGLKESFTVWAILVCLVFVFSVLLTTYVTDEMRDTSFSSIGLSMNLLVASGILLDGVRDVLDDMAGSRDVAGYVLFLVFVLISQYVILNMLIGMMTSVAMEVRGEEKARSSLVFLRHSLKNILECYIHDDGMISRREFGLILLNADVHRILRYFGTDIEHLASMEKSLYAKTDFIDFDSLFETISHLNAGKLSTVRDIFRVQDALQRKLFSIESQLASAGFHGVP